MFLLTRFLFSKFTLLSFTIKDKTKPLIEIPCFNNNLQFTSSKNSKQILKDKIKFKKFILYKKIFFTDNPHLNYFLKQIEEDIQQSFIKTQLIDLLFPETFFTFKDELIHFNFKLQNISKTYSYFLKINIQDAYYNINLSQLFHILKFFISDLNLNILITLYLQLSSFFESSYLFVGFILSDVLFNVFLQYIFLLFYYYYDFKNIIIFHDNIILFSNSLTELTYIFSQLQDFLNYFHLFFNSKKTDIINLYIDDLIFYDRVMLSNHSHHLTSKTQQYLSQYIYHYPSRHNYHLISFLPITTIKYLKHTNPYLYKNLFLNSFVFQFIEKLKNYEHLSTSRSILTIPRETIISIINQHEFNLLSVTTY